MMAYIFGLLGGVLIFVMLHYFTKLQLSQKIKIFSFLFIVTVLAVAYNRYVSMQEEKLLQNVLKFRQQKTIRCNGIDVNSTNFTLSIGTYTFIGKKNTPYYAQMISASSCE